MPDYFVAGTGAKSLQTKPHEVKQAAYQAAKESLLLLQGQHGPSLVTVSGMAEGFDKAIAIAAIELHVRLWLALPNAGYLKYYWQQHSLTGKNMLPAAEAICLNAEKIILVTEDIFHRDTGELYYPGNGECGVTCKSKHANFHRNDYMVMIGNEFLVWDPTSSGTKDCLASIEKAGKPFTVLS